MTRAQAVRLGLSCDAIDRRLAVRRWVPTHPRVYRDARWPLTEASRMRAAVLWAGAGAVLSGAAAAWWWGLLEVAPVTVVVTVPRRRAPRSRPGVQVRRRDADPADVTEHAGVAVAIPAAAVLQAVQEPGIAGEELLTGMLCGAADGPAPGLDALLLAQARTGGAHGSARTGRLLATAVHRAVGHGRHRLRELLVRHRVPGWRTDHVIAGVVLPVAFPRERVAVEIRGGGSGPDACGAAWRRAVLRRHGWHTVTLDPSDPIRRPVATVQAIGAALAGRPQDPGGASARASS
ncbi:hypothetical protein [Pseudonocardia sp. HH130630-07]|uniref:hypothetical protein n=1 Tax=Pseudonocardia sp. HH130630-07 TaxID=1690815 RepID=UPI000814CE06|nr:hypothetical protein [Pseudonocardia sp. HH130630-07]ANY05991.1 hypothetical protein AFB00_06375 [Pseudonocardia sp. HH130630-07]